MRYDVCGLGNALVDALLVLDERDILARHALTRGTMLLVDHARWTELHAEVRDQGVEFQAGGSCANTISTLALLGGQATFIGQVGADAFGEVYKERLSTVLGEHHMVTAPDLSTGKCLSLVSSIDAERTMCTNLGAAVELSAEDVDYEAIAASKWLHITGYVLTGGKMAETAWRVLDHAVRVGTRISFDIGDAFVIQHFREAAERVLRDYADLAFLNEEEARLLTGSDAAEALHDVGKLVDIAVIKLGKRGSLVKRGDQVIPIEALRVDAVDTTGAGDAYAGGFLYGLTQGKELRHCGRLASAVAAQTVAQLGAVLRDPEALEQIVGGDAPVAVAEADRLNT